MSVTIEIPNSPVRQKKGVNWEKWGWIYMRVSGIALVVLIFGHLFVNLMIGEGVKAIDFAFVAESSATLSGWCGTPPCCG
jgi:Succinate dehydrogenase, hydrophobic anchor subunit